MKRIKRLSFIQPNSKIERPGVVLVLALILIFGVLNFSCNKNKNVDEYYIKYEVNSSTIYYGGKLNVALMNETNGNSNVVINTRGPWETIIGPVQKGFNATMGVSSAGETYNKLKIYTQISVSKNNGPFALKKLDGSETPRNACQINYIIDF